MAEGPEMRGLIELRVLAERLKDAGNEGKGLRRELMKQLNEVAKPLTKKITDVEHLKPYMPDRYAAVLAPELSANAQRVFSGNPRISISAKTRRERRRRVNLLDDGMINHPKWPGHRPRKKWKWQNRQTGGMKQGFFSDVIDDAMPDLREKVLAAITETNRKIMR